MKKADVTSAAAGVFRDVLTGTAIPGQAICLTDGKYGWRSDVTYYVEKYNMKLPQEFVDHKAIQETCDVDGFIRVQSPAL